jgi:DNA mismatch repair protein MutH
MGGAIDINILAVACVMDRKGIPLEDQDELLEQVQQLAGVVLRERAAEAEARREADNTDRGRR